VTSRAPFDRAADATLVASPCTSVCRMDAETALCVGCLRTIDEIAAWQALDADARRGVLAEIARRRRRIDAARPHPDAKR
jgi:predicted Fe-S protein YdhL (DUF1289 family)